MLRKLVNYVTSLVKFNKAGCPYAPCRVLLERLNACNHCKHIGRFIGDPSLVKIAGTTDLDFCNKCGCSLHEKAEMLTESCPVNSWQQQPAVKVTDNGRTGTAGIS